MLASPLPAAPRTPPVPACTLCEVPLPRERERFELPALVAGLRGQEVVVCELCHGLGRIAERIRELRPAPSERALVVGELTVILAALTAPVERPRPTQRCPSPAPSSPTSGSDGSEGKSEGEGEGSPERARASSRRSAPSFGRWWRRRRRRQG